MKRFSAFIISSLLLLSGCSEPKQKIHLIGDSTMADYEENVTQSRGWGEMFRLFVPENVTVLDHAKPGRSSRSFYDEGLWEAVKSQVSPGDYVLIQFAHNDEKEQGRDGADGRGTAPWTTYREYLTRYVDETRQLGATPIFVQPIVRRYFDGNKITPRACHNLGLPADTSLNYPAVMRRVAADTNTPIVDLCAKTRQIVEAYGPSDSKAQLYVQADNTHTAMKGAAIFALAVAEALDTMNIWKSGSVRHPSIVTNPSSYNFGEVFIGDTVWQTFDVLDFEGVSTLTPKCLTHRETITVSASPGLKVSADLKSPLLDSISFYTNCGANVIVRYAPRTGLKEVMKLKVATPSGSVIVPIKAQGRMLSHSDAVALTWRDVQKQFESNELNAKVSLLKGMTVSEDGFNTESGFWPSEIDENGERYVQLTLTAGSRTLRIKNFALKTTGSFSYRASYAFGKDFFHNMVIGERQAPVEDNFSEDSYKTSISLKPGQSLLVRLYPWSRNTTDKAVFNIKDISIDASAVE